MSVSAEQPEDTAAELSRHWDAAYARAGAERVSWHQDDPVLSLSLFDELEVRSDTPVIDVGGGASVLVDRLVERGFTDVSVVDASPVALALVRARLPAAALARVHLLHGDVLAWRPARRFGAWHDRAVFHFLVDPDDRARYLATLRAATVEGGLVIVGTFAADGPETCSGLPVARYSPEELVAALGPGFEPLVTRREEHVTPTGRVQPFTWLGGRVGAS